MILLAPMEGLLDFVLRDILTRVGGIDRCVSEFIRITDQLLPERVFTRIVPELHNGGRTFAGVPVRAQLLGSDPACMADNAARLASLGPAGIDLNFGCPANVVNRHGGGAALLKEPETIHAIVTAVRRAVPAHMPVSAKMRLGYLDDSRAVECALAIAKAVPTSWWCMPAPRPRLTARLRIGSALPTFVQRSRSRWWPMAKSGRWTTRAAAKKSQAATC
jgi:tRNA-dihydrouridine synthase C